MTPQSIIANLIVKSCKVADVYNKSSLNDVFIAKVDASICNILRNYRAPYSQADLTHIVFYADTLIAIQRLLRNEAKNATDENTVRAYYQKYWNRTLADIVNKETSTSPSHKYLTQLRLQPVLHKHKSSSQTTTAGARPVCRHPCHRLDPLILASAAMKLASQWHVCTSLAAPASSWL